MLKRTKLAGIRQPAKDTSVKVPTAAAPQTT
jgi:hypothetical protein